MGEFQYATSEAPSQRPGEEAEARRLQLEASGIRAGESQEGGHHEGCTPVGCGWVKETALTEMLGPKFMQVWTPLKGLVR